MSSERVSSAGEGSPGLFAVSDLHVAFPQNREFTEALKPQNDGDWLIVAGDTAENVADIEWVLSTLAGRFARVVWTPGNHELWTPKSDPVRLTGRARYEHLVEICRGLGVVTPEDPYPVWEGAEGPVTVAPLFLMYDYSFRPRGTATKDEALDVARAAGVVCTDEYLIVPEPYAGMDEWCHERVASTARRLDALAGDVSTVLVSHWPLTRHPTDILTYPEFALWCGTELTADWHVRYRAAAVVYGHLHIPRTMWHDGVRFQEVSVGYPREWKRDFHRDPGLHRILPAPQDAPAAA